MIPRQSVFLAVGLRAMIERGGTTRFILWDVEEEARAKRPSPVWAMLVELDEKGDGNVERSIVITQRANELPKVKVFRSTDAAITQMVKLYDRPELSFPLRPDEEYQYEKEQLQRLTTFCDTLSEQYRNHLRA